MTGNERIARELVTRWLQDCGLERCDVIGLELLQQRIVDALNSPLLDTLTDVLNGIRDALETRGYFHMANGRDIGLLLDELRAVDTTARDLIKALLQETDALMESLDERDGWTAPNVFRQRIAKALSYLETESHI